MPGRFPRKPVLASARRAKAVRVGRFDVESSARLEQTAHELQRGGRIRQMLDNVGHIDEVEARRLEVRVLQCADEDVDTEAHAGDLGSRRVELDTYHPPSMTLEVAEIEAVAAADVERGAARAIV